jgi:hypothetical protein
MPRRKKSEQRSSVLTVMEMMRLSKRELRSRKRSNARPAEQVSHEETGRLGPDDLKRWRKPEKPIKIIG